MIAIQVDTASLAKLQAKLGRGLYEDAVKAAFIDVAHAAEGEIKARTPFVTGNLRRSEQSIVNDAGRFPNPESRVRVHPTMTGKSKRGVTVTMAEYAWWIETGENRTTGAKMKSKPGGYRMFAEGRTATEQRVPQIVAGIVNEIESRWGQ